MLWCVWIVFKAWKRKIIDSVYGHFVRIDVRERVDCAPAIEIGYVVTREGRISDSLIEVNREPF